MATSDNLSGPSGADEPPVDLERMNDLTGGEPEGLRELVDMYLAQTDQQLDLINAAIQTGKSEDVRREAHSCGGASATLGMTRLGTLLRDLELLGKAGNLTNAAGLCASAKVELQRVREFLAIHLAG